MTINFPTNNLRDGDTYTSPDMPEVTYTYNGSIGAWVVNGNQSQPAVVRQVDIPFSSFKGEWNNFTSYSPGDVVHWTNGYYICRTGNTNLIPYEGLRSDSWLRFIDQNLAWRGAWSNVQDRYYINDVVSHNGSIYVCMVDSQLVSVPGLSVQWTLLASSGSGSALTVKDEGTAVNQQVSNINFIGAGVTVTNANNTEITVTVPGSGYTGSAGPSGGFVGSRGFNGSNGFLGSRGYTGSAGAGYSGSRGFVGSTGTGFIGSRGYTGSASTAAGFSGSRGSNGFTGSAGPSGGYTGSLGYAGSAGSSGSMLTVKDEGQTVLGTGLLRTIDFVGAGVTVSPANNTEIKVDIPGAARTSFTFRPSNLANGASQWLLAGIDAKTYALLSVQASAGVWVTIYSSRTAMSADENRTILVDPALGSGVIAETITNSATTTYFTPAVIGSNNDAPPTNTMYVRIVNNSGSTQTTSTVNIAYVPLER